MDEGWDGAIQADTFVEILLLIPPSARRRLRFVCRYWRKVIDERAPEAKNRAVPLAFVINDYMSAAHPVGEGSRDSRRGALWTTYARRRQPGYGQWYCWWLWEPGSYHRFDTALVGTCNGLLCLCDNTQPGGAITLVNPATKETLAVPRLPGSAQWDEKLVARWSEAYNFVFDTMRGRYMIVHLPCCFDRIGQFDRVHVFTLGDTSSPSWRDVPAPAGASCCLKLGVVGFDGATYWVSKDTERVVSFDHEDERITSTVTLPVAARPGCSRCLTEVQGRLGVVEYCIDRKAQASIQIWVLGDGTDRQTWSRRYSVQVHKVQQRLALPLFVHGQSLLTYDTDQVEEEDHIMIYGHKMQRDPRWVQCSEVRISEHRMGMKLTSMLKGDRLQIFAYVETKEPLSIYGL